MSEKQSEKQQEEEEAAGEQLPATSASTTTQDETQQQQEVEAQYGKGDDAEGSGNNNSAVHNNKLSEFLVGNAGKNVYRCPVCKDIYCSCAPQLLSARASTKPAAATAVAATANPVQQQNANSEGDASNKQQEQQQQRPATSQQGFSLPYPSRCKKFELPPCTALSQHLASVCAHTVDQAPSSRKYQQHMPQPPQSSQSHKISLPLPLSSLRTATAASAGTTGGSQQTRYASNGKPLNQIISPRKGGFILHPSTTSGMLATGTASSPSSPSSSQHLLLSTQKGGTAKSAPFSDAFLTLSARSRLPPHPALLHELPPPPAVATTTCRSTKQLASPRADNNEATMAAAAAANASPSNSARKKKKNKKHQQQLPELAPFDDDNKKLSVSPRGERIGKGGTLRFGGEVV